MTTEPERQSLSAFLAHAGPGIDQAIVAGRQGALGVADYLVGHLHSEPELTAQMDKFRDALPADLTGQPLSVRAGIVRTAKAVLADVKARWIAAENPPLVDEIDDRLGEIGRHLEEVERPHTDQLSDAARQIEDLANQTADLESVEQRLLIPAVGAVLLFLLGLVLIIWPVIFRDKPPDTASFEVLACLSALPILAFYYAVKIKPRSQIDQRIDALNRQYFLPNGGIYFPTGPHGACVMRVDWIPPEPELPLDKAPRDPRKNRDPEGRDW
ncbi:MAG: hypothetical protein AAF674_19485 [Pseudomonadota bacterium]